MARVHTVKKSRKDQGTCGKCGDALLAGSAYRHFSPGFRSRKRKRCMKGGCSPRPSDLTASDKKQRIYEAQETVEDELRDWDRKDVSALKDLLETLNETINEVAEEYTEAAEHFGGEGENAERAEELESWGGEVENAASELESAEDRACEDCGGDGHLDCPKECSDGVADEDCEDCGGEGRRDCTASHDGLSDGEKYDPGDYDDCVDDHDDHTWDGANCTRKGCDYVREPDEFCNQCRSDGGEEECPECDGGQVEGECSNEECRDEADHVLGLVPCSNEDCDGGEVKHTEEWAEEIESLVSDAVGGCPL